MTKYHNSPHTGKLSRCRAKDACPFGPTLGTVIHRDGSVDVGTGSPSWSEKADLLEEHNTQERIIVDENGVAKNIWMKDDDSIAVESTNTVAEPVRDNPATIHFESLNTVGETTELNFYTEDGKTIVDYPISEFMKPREADYDDYVPRNLRSLSDAEKRAIIYNAAAEIDAKNTEYAHRWLEKFRGRGQLKEIDRKLEYQIDRFNENEDENTKEQIAERQRILDSEKELRIIGEYTDERESTNNDNILNQWNRSQFIDSMLRQGKID